MVSLQHSQVSALCSPGLCSPWRPQPSLCISPLLPSLPAALSEAQDIALHLTALQQPLEHIEAAEFSRVKPLLVPLLHVVCWVWATCGHYSVPLRLVVLLQEICNLLIQQVRAPGTCACTGRVWWSLLSLSFPCPSLQRDSD